MTATNQTQLDTTPDITDLCFLLACNDAEGEDGNLTVRDARRSDWLAKARVDEAAVRAEAVAEFGALDAEAVEGLVRAGGW